MGRKYKICFFSGDISKNGGTERVATIIANGLAEKGHEVFFLSYKNGLVSHYLLNEKIELYSLNMQNYNGFLSRKIMPYKKLIDFFREHNADIVVDIDILLSLYTLPIKKIIKVKVISWEHFNLFSNRIKTRVLARRLATLFSDKVVTLNKHDMANYLKITPKGRKKNIKYIYNPAINNSPKTTNLMNKRVIAVGRLTYQKNFQLLIRLWKEVENSNPDWELVIVGDGEEKFTLEELMKELGVRNAKIIGFNDNIEKMYEESSILVMTSRYEGLPMVLLEGQKKGLPIVAFNCPTGPSEIVLNERNGFLINLENETYFIECLDNLMNNFELLKRFSKNAINDSERFNKDQIIDKWIKLFNTLN